MQAKSPKTTTPDFRYPETVMKNATIQYKNALKSGNGQDLVDGIVKFSLAKSKISADYMPELIHLTDSIAGITTDKCIRALLYSLEADMCLHVYDSFRYKINSRTEIKDSIPTDIMEWSRQNFIDETCRLVTLALADKKELAAANVKDYKKIIVSPKVLPEFAPSLYDMIAYQSIRQLGEVCKVPTLPLREFTNYKAFITHPTKISDTAVNAIFSIYASLLELHKNDDAAFIYADLKRLDDTFEMTISSGYEKAEEKHAEALLELYNKYAGNQYATEILVKLSTVSDNQEKVYALCQQQVKKFPAYPRIAALKNFIAQYEQQSVSIFYPSCVTSADSIQLEITAKNVEAMTVRAYKLPFRTNYDSKFLSQLSKFKVAKTQSFHFNLDDSTHISKTALFPNLSPGNYLIVAEFTDRKTKEKVRSSYKYGNNVINVSDVKIFHSNINGEVRIYAINAQFGKPLMQAKLHFIDKDEKESIQKTNRYGYAVIPQTKANGTIRIYATYANDTTQVQSFFNYQSRTTQAHRRASVYTDLAVYRPGDTVKFAVIAYDTDSAGVCVSSRHTVTAKLFNANSKQIDEFSLVTDEFGRADSAFILPKEGLTGRFSIRIVDNSPKQTIATNYFNVSEYKAPTFYVELDRAESNLTNNDSLRVCGKAATYAGFPIANAKVSYELTPHYYYFCPESNESASGEATTDEQGRWSLPISDDIFGGDEKYGSFRLTVTVTSENGESQTLTESIGIGTKLHIEWMRDRFLVPRDSKEPAFLVKDINEKQVATDCSYSLEKGNKTVATGMVNSSNPVIDFSNIPSGQYDLTLALSNGQNTNDTQKIIVYRQSDLEPPVETPLWIPETTVHCDAEGNYSVKLGNSHDGYIFAAAYNDNKVFYENWHFFESGMHELAGKAQFGKDCDRANLYLIGIHNNRIEERTVTLVAATPKDSVKIVTETFRDNLVPGSKETWKLRISGNNGKHYTGAVIANMYDAALNKIAANRYYFYIQKLWKTQFSTNINRSYNLSLSASSTIKSLNTPNFTLPELNYYGQSFGYPAVEELRLFSVAEMKGEMKGVMEAKAAHFADTGNAAEDSTLSESVVVATGSPQEGELHSSDSEFQFRNDDIKTAFFLPALVTDENGEVTIQFDVPNRNTQWQFSAIAYTADMKYDVLNRLVTASRPLMVQSNLPRFIRTGDDTAIRATVMNKSDKQITASIAIEWFDLQTGNAIKAEELQKEISANGSTTVETEIKAPEGLDFIGYRIKASTDEYSDGEQHFIAVLPATADVVEAEPFYLNAGQNKWEAKLPKFAKNGKLTFEYSDNPTWYVATALPSVLSTSETASAIASNYYLTVVADNIVSNNPDIAQAIKHWNETKELKSNLQKNTDLKTLSLDNTPWVQTAETESDMMAKLIELTYPATLQYREQKALVALKDLQNADGSFSWFKGAEGSAFLTESILSYFGSLQELGYAKNDMLANDIVKKAIDFRDNDIIKALRRAEKPENLYSNYKRYIYIRSMFSVPLPSELQPVKLSTLNAAIKNWGNYDAAEKAETAIMFANYGKKDIASQIVESLRQSARKSENKGMYWDLENTDKVSTAATAVRAFHKLNPDDSDIDRIRQWLLLQKETQFWGSSVAAINAIDALLATGTKWTNTERKTPEIKIGNIRIEADNADAYFGYLKRSIDLDASKGNKLTIHREGNNPAWGAIYCQYNAPMKEIMKQSSPEIKVDKQFFIYRNGKLESTPESTFRIGDRVQVRVTIRTERDLDFAAFTDDRAACFEPVDQLPVYERIDGVRCYRETRDSATNIFFSSLRKGTYVISYDVTVNNAGQFNSGITTVQCQYAPQIVAHSAGSLLEVK